MSFKRLVAIFIVYLLTCAAWIALAGVTNARTDQQSSSLRSEVNVLWGSPQGQTAPQLAYRAVIPADKNLPSSQVIARDEAMLLKLEWPDLKPKDSPKPAPSSASSSAEHEELLWVLRSSSQTMTPSSSSLRVDLHTDPQRKGLVWFSLYDVKFQGEYTYVHEQPTAGYLDIQFVLPAADYAIYDELVFQVDGVEKRGALDGNSGKFSYAVPVVPGSRVTFSTAYKSRGEGEWSYRPSAQVGQLENFRLNLTTDFRDIDFPQGTSSPTSRTKTPRGFDLEWDLRSTVTGQGMGMIMPRLIQPGELSTALIYSAPVSLMFFFLVLFVLSTLRRLDIHPINYMFLGGAFFAFHLLFSYSADHLTVPWAFAASSVVSMVLVVTYLRLVISPQFALREAAAAQFVYLIGFSLAHFWAGFTGLTITVLAIVTLFILMQATGRIQWSTLLASKSRPPNESTQPLSQ